MIDETAVPTGARARPPFWLGLLSGRDNQTPAIGRVLGAVIGLVLVVDLLVGLPTLVACVLLLQKVAPQTWFAFMGALTPYITAGAVAIGGLVGGLIAGTAFTEPRGPGR
jgi:hypothetical protein